MSLFTLFTIVNSYMSAVSVSTRFNTFNVINICKYKKLCEVDLRSCKSLNLLECGDSLAKKYLYIKFCKGNVFDYFREIKKNDDNIPFILIYKEGKNITNIGGISVFNTYKIDDNILENKIQLYVHMAAIKDDIFPPKLQQFC